MRDPTPQYSTTYLSHQNASAQLPVTVGFHDLFAPQSIDNAADSFVGFPPDLQLLLGSFGAGAGRDEHRNGFGSQYSSHDGWDAGGLSNKMGASEASNGATYPASWPGGEIGGSFVAREEPSDLVFAAATGSWAR